MITKNILAQLTQQQQQKFKLQKIETSNQRNIYQRCDTIIDDIRTKDTGFKIH